MKPHRAGTPMAGTPFRGARIVAVLAPLTLLLYAWVLYTSFPVLPRLGSPQDDDYTLLVHGFLKGHLYLDAPVPRALLESKNPYDPAQRPPGMGLHDVSLFRGRYTLYFGAAPAVTLLLPWRIATGADLPLPYGVLIFCSGAYLALTAAFLRARNRLYPESGAAATVAGLLVLSFATMALVLLRRASMYEFAIAGGMFYFGAFIFLALEWLARPSSVGKAFLPIATGLALGLAIASRPNYVAAAAVLLIPLLLDRRSFADRLRAVFPAFIGLGLILAVLFWYNDERYGNPLEFGMGYALSGIIEARARHFSPFYFPANFYTYLLAPLHWGRYFPFVHGITLPPRPRGYGDIDSAYGLWPNAPFTLFSFAAAWAFRRKQKLGLSPGSPRDRDFAVVALAHLTVAVLIFCFYWAIIRYMADFTPALILLSALSLLDIERRLGGATARGRLAALGLALSISTIFVAWFVSFQLYGRFEGSRPDLYRAVGRIFDTPVAWAERLAGTKFGPVEIQAVPPSSPGRSALLVATGWPPHRDSLSLECVAPHLLRFAFAHGDGEPPVYSPGFRPPAGPLRITVEMGSLYPPVEHPYFRRLSPGQIHHLKNWLRVSVGGSPSWALPAEFFDSSAGTLRLPFPSTRTGAPAPAADTPWPAGPASARIEFRRDMAGRTFPLVTTGRYGYGDVLRFTVLPNGTVAFGYDYWGKPGLSSPAFPLVDGRSHSVEFEIPSMTRPGVSDSAWVEIDGSLAWKVAVRHHPGDPYQVYPGRNAIGASACEPALEGVRVLPAGAPGG